MELLQALKKVKSKFEDGTISEWAGLCYNLEDQEYTNSKSEELRCLFRAWPKFSGNIKYPVHSGIKNMARYVYGSTDNLWNQKTVYGRNRLELLNWCIEQLESKEKPVEYKAGQRFKIKYPGETETSDVILANVGQWSFALIDLHNGNRIMDSIELFPRTPITEEHMKQMLGNFKIVS